MSRFNPTTPDDIASRLAELKRKLASREGQKEYRDNVPALRAEIARLEGLQA